jgi:hypothetical protein
MESSHWAVGGYGAPVARRLRERDRFVSSVAGETVKVGIDVRCYEGATKIAPFSLPGARHSVPLMHFTGSLSIASDRHPADLVPEVSTAIDDYLESEAE